MYIHRERVCVCVCAYCNEETTRQSINQCNLGSRVWRTLVRIYVDYLFLWMGGSLGLVINMRLTWRRHMTSRLPATDKAAPDKPALCWATKRGRLYSNIPPSSIFYLPLSLDSLLCLCLSGRRVSQFWRFVYTARKLVACLGRLRMGNCDSGPVSR